MNESVGRNADYCRFVQEGNVFVRWDGEVCPCMSLLHESKTYLYNYERKIEAASFGNIANNSLAEIWDSDKYSSFRDQVMKFDFSPCVLCGGCSDLDENATDCFGNPFPTCGGCLWAQGFIQCP
jgi:MoaA/NifB/PqqE/SkfB family radical SAM enzyme